MKRTLSLEDVRAITDEELARANVNVQTALLLAGDSDAKSHQRYINSIVGRELPEGALPLAPPFRFARPVQIEKQKPRKTGAGHGVRTRDPELGKLVLYQLS